MIVAFLATSTLACAVTFNDNGDIHSASTYQKASDSPYSSDQQLPFEEKEKEFEDKDEVDDKGSAFGVGLHFICYIETDYDRVDYSLATVRTFSPTKNLPLFLSTHTLLI